MNNLQEIYVQSKYVYSGFKLNDLPTFAILRVDVNSPYKLGMKHDGFPQWLNDVKWITPIVL